jgi:chromosome partitioning protein
MSAVVVSVCSLKGGVGKSTIAGGLASTWAREGRRCLVIDCDPQQSLGLSYFSPEVIRSTPKEATIAALFGDGLAPEPAELIRPTQFPGISILLGSGHFARYNVPEPWLCRPDQQRALRDFVAEVRGDADRIILDCPPTLFLASWAALQASDHLLCPLQAEAFSAQGVASTIEVADAVRAHGNPSLARPLYVLNQHNGRLAIHRAYESMFRQLHESAVLGATVPIASEFKEAAASRKSVVDVKPRGAAAKALQALADELTARFAAGRAGDDRDGSRRVA